MVAQQQLAFSDCRTWVAVICITRDETIKIGYIKRIRMTQLLRLKGRFIKHVDSEDFD